MVHRPPAFVGTFRLAESQKTAADTLSPVPQTTPCGILLCYLTLERSTYEKATTHFTQYGFRRRVCGHLRFVTHGVAYLFPVVLVFMAIGLREVELASRSRTARAKLCRIRKHHGETGWDMTNVDRFSQSLTDNDFDWSKLPIEA